MDDRAKTVSQWETSLISLLQYPRESLRAVTYRRGWRTKAEPVLLECEDDQTYVVKGIQAGRQIINDQVVARLGMALGAPVGIPRLIEVSAELIELDRRLKLFSPGLAHGTLWIPNCLDSVELLGTGEVENRSRYALLSALFGWVINHDPQYLVNEQPPRLVHSVDHGHCFSGGPNWTIESLQKSIEFDSELNLEFLLFDRFEMCCFKPIDFQKMRQNLKQVTELHIFSSVASVPEDWGITMDERLILVEYLFVRQQRLVLILERLSSEAQ
jgi:hypothetical protein